MATSSTIRNNGSSSSSSTIIGSQQYPYPSHVNAASFVSIKLSGECNYLAWKAQMICLLDGHDMRGFINGTVTKPQQYNGSKATVENDFEATHREWERLDNLVKGWIFGSLNEDVMKTVASLRTANDVWNKLKEDYTVEPRNQENFDNYNPLCRDLQLGHWEKAQEFLTTNEGARTAKLNSYGQRSLHVAIGYPHDTTVLTNLLLPMNSNQLQGLVDNSKQTALHYAAVLGNTEAARLLVKKERALLYTGDSCDYFPIHKAIINSHEATFKYLLNEHLNETEINIRKTFEGDSGALLLCETIMAGFLDVAYELLRRFPDLATTVPSGRVPPLCCIAIKRDSYLSAKGYNFYDRIVSFGLYCNPLCRALQKGDWDIARKFLNVDKITSTGNQNSMDQREPHSENDMPTVNRLQDRIQHVYKCMKSRVNYGIKAIVGILRIILLLTLIDKIVIKLLEFLSLPWLHIKRLKKEKVEHNLALMILRFICERVSKLTSDQDKHYEQAYFTAVKNDTLEVVQQITKKFPQSILMADATGHMLSQLSIINRSEKIYNFFVHKVTHNKYLHIVTTDKENNNLLHLAGQLAPTHRLNMVTGAALQMQRELQWFEEVKNLMRPKDSEAMNRNEETPIMVFRKAHAKLRKEGEVWIKKVADSYTITAVLIITIVFAAAITIPGGTDEKGKANFENKLNFIIFIVSDAISLFTSTIALLLSLSILTTRYAEEDFLYKIPNRLMSGLLMLFISVAMMLVAFGAALHIMFWQDHLKILIIIGPIVCLPITVFMVLQLSLLVDLISSSYGNGIFRKRSELRITS